MSADVIEPCMISAAHVDGVATVKVDPAGVGRVNLHEDHMEADGSRTDHSDALRQFVGKTTGAVARIALAIHCAEWAFEAAADPLGWDIEIGADVPCVMTRATLDRAWRLYRKAIVPSTVNVYR